MKRLLGIGAALVVVFAMASPALARPLNWNGTLTSRFGEFQPLVNAGGGVAEVNGSSGPIPAHLDTLGLTKNRNIAGTDTVIVTDPETLGNGIAAIIINAAIGTGVIGPVSGAFASTSPGLTQKTLPVKGVAKVCLLSTVCTDFLPLLLTQPTTNGARYQVGTATPMQLTPGGLQGKRIGCSPAAKNLGVCGTGVKGVGVGGLITVGGDSPIRISVEAAPWTIKTATAIDQTDDMGQFVPVTGMGFAHGPASGTTSTAQPSGVLQIVTPSQVRTNLPFGTSVKTSVISELLIHFIPEPGMLLLIGSGVVGLAVLGRNRMKS